MIVHVAALYRPLACVRACVHACVWYVQTSRGSACRCRNAYTVQHWDRWAPSSFQQHGDSKMFLLASEKRMFDLLAVRLLHISYACHAFHHSSHAPLQCAIRQDGARRRPIGPAHLARVAPRVTSCHSSATVASCWTENIVWDSVSQPVLS